MKNKLKNFLYDKNDIIIAICILLVAVMLIFWRINVIMQYPEKLAQETHAQTTTSGNAVDDDNKEN